MKRLARILTVAGLVAALAAWGGGAAPPAPAQSAPGQAAPPAAPAQAPVQGYTRTNKKTGQLIQVRPYKRRAPAPKAVQVRSYLRKDLHVMGYQRRLPGVSKP